jgi:mRNA interferase HigB
MAQFKTFLNKCILNRHLIVTNLVTLYYICNEDNRDKNPKQFWEENPVLMEAILIWYEKANAAQWNTTNKLKAQFGSVSVITSKRVVFNIHCNNYRLIVDIEYRLKIVFVVWIGSLKNMIKLMQKR